MKRSILLLWRFCFVLILGFCCAHSLRAENLNRQNEVERLRTQKGILAYMFFGDTNSPVNRVVELAKQPFGMLGVNDLLPYLTNTSPSGLESLKSRQKRPYQINEIIAEIITRVAGHNFYIASGDNITLHLTDVASVADTNVIRWFQDQVQRWCLLYGNRSVEDRKIIDLNDWFHYNRFDAYKWLGEAKSAKGRLPIERRVDFLLNETPLRLDTLMQSEMVACAEALAGIGDPRSADLVKKVCDHLWQHPIHGSSMIQEVCDAYRAWAGFGNKVQALKDLQSYKNKYEAELEPRTRRELEDRLKDAEKW